MAQIATATADAHSPRPGALALVKDALTSDPSHCAIVRAAIRASCRRQVMG